MYLAYTQTFFGELFVSFPLVLFQPDEFYVYDVFVQIRIFIAILQTIFY